MYVYSIYDEKALCYGLPFFQKTDGIALRLFNDLVNDPDSSLYKHPSDYKLYRIGEYDEVSALLEPITPLFLAHGAFNNVVDAIPEKNT